MYFSKTWLAFRFRPFYAMNSAGKRVLLHASVPVNVGWYTFSNVFMYIETSLRRCWQAYASFVITII